MSSKGLNSKFFILRGLLDEEFFFEKHTQDSKLKSFDVGN